MDLVSENVYWIGFIDWNLRNFHGYSTPSGSTYNAYFIDDEMPTVIDSVKHYGADEMIRRLKEVTDVSKIKYIVSNHTEMDHSGSIDRLLELAPDAQVICSPKGEEHLKRHFKKDWNLKVVQNGESLSIGKRTLTFVHTPMVHWPDNMVTYCAEDKILFSNDAFGQHYASSERFADEVGMDTVIYEAGKYYANIVLPYGNQVQKAISALKDIEIDKIFPSHGLLWRRKEDIARLLENYQKWSTHETEDRVVIVYDTMWHSTERMARKLLELVEQENMPVVFINLQEWHISDVITEVLRSKFLLIGSPILNNCILPTMASLLTYMKGLKPKNRIACPFGSYGWATIGYKAMEADLAAAGFELPEKGAYFKFVPDEEELDSLSSIIEFIKSK